MLKRQAVIYVRQSTQSQVMTNLESQRRQYDLVEMARGYGFSAIDVIDDDLGISASGCQSRPGFEKLVAMLCSGSVGAVFCLEVSRLARNGRDWHHMLELCGLVEARVVDHDGVYDPRAPNDRLLLGMKGSISEFELGVLRTRMVEAARAKARRGELRYTPPIGYLWDREAGVMFDPDLRIQEVIRQIFSRFRELGSARQVLLSLSAEGVHFPRPSDGIRMTTFDWRPIRYRNVSGVLKNMFYAGVYAYGKTGRRAEIRDGRAHVTYKNRKSPEDWDVVIKDHHVGYIDWEEHERNQAQLARNAFGRAGGVKSGRGGGALLAGMLCCARCGRRLHVVYAGRKPRPVYRCDTPNLLLGQKRCITFGGLRAETLVTGAVLEAVAPLAIEAAAQARANLSQAMEDKRKVLEMELQQARYDASLAERRYAACDPDNRLIAAELERRWEEALQRVRSFGQRLDMGSAAPPEPDISRLDGLARDLEAAWSAPAATMRDKQRLIRTLIEDIVADIDDSSGEIVLVVHWKGGRHSELRVRKPRPGEHNSRTSGEALAVIREMAGRWPDEAIAACLNRMGMPTGQGKTWTAKRVSSIRRVNDIHGYLSADKDGPWRTMTEAAKELGVTNHVIRALIRDGILPANQVVDGAPYQIRAEDLRSEQVQKALARKGRPCRTDATDQLQMFPSTCEKGAE
nr:recombinase family protein [Poseidonocella sp. HB161398]